MYFHSCKQSIKIENSQHEFGFSRNKTELFIPRFSKTNSQAITRHIRNLVYGHIKKRDIIMLLSCRVSSARHG